MSYYQLTSHILLAAEGFAESVALSNAMKAAGYDKSAQGGLSKLGHDAEALIEKRMNVFGADRIVEHNVHVAVGEVEMWMQTIRFLLRKGVTDPQKIQMITGSSLHAHEHTTTAIMQAQRMLAAIRTDQEVADSLGDARKIRDFLTRGWTLLNRLFATTEIRLAAPKGKEDDAIVGDMSTMAERLRKELHSLDAAAARVDEVPLLGYLGWVPQNTGIPVGGTAYGVILHERGQTSPPDPKDKRPTSGWSIGRQGRNNENLGNGFTPLDG